MSIHYTDNPYNDFLSHEAEQEKWLAKLPICAKCKIPIQDEYCYEINGEVLCEDCMKEEYRRDVDSYID